MQFDTTRFGKLEIDEKELIHFPWGIPGFEAIKSYILLQYRDGPFQWLQSVEEPSVAFVVCPPGVIGLEYDIPESKTKPIELENQDDLLVLNIVSFNPDNKQMRFHVRSPLLFNASTRLGYQWTMEGDDLKKHLATPAGPAPDIDPA
jgi:flagellar assembly factor FliW